MKTVAFMPIKLNNERVPGKNIKEFDDGTPLMKVLLRTLSKVKNLDEIYVYCSNEAVKDYLIPGVKFLKRDEKYDTQDADILCMFRAFALEVEADNYLIAHATQPFITPETFEKAISLIQEEDYDSVVPVKGMKEFYWENGKPSNYDLNKIPRTQDLPEILVETAGVYLYKKSVIVDHKRRIGFKPYLLKVNTIESIDINYPEDFEIANAIYMNCIKKLED